MYKRNITIHGSSYVTTNQFSLIIIFTHFEVLPSTKIQLARFETFSLVYLASENPRAVCRTITYKVVFNFHSCNIWKKNSKHYFQLSTDRRSNKTNKYIAQNMLRNIQPFSNIRWVFFSPYSDEFWHAFQYFFFNYSPIFV